MTHLRTHHQQGFALITTLIMLIVFLAIITTYTFLTTIETKTSDASVDSATGFYAAESGYNLRAEDIRTVFQDFRRPQGTSPNGTTPCVDGNDGSGAFECVSYKLNDRTIHTYVQEDTRNGADGRSTTVSTGTYAGLNAIEYGYNFFSDAYPPNDTRPEASVETRLNVNLIPLFQFAAFYNKDLEIHPGPSMTLNGRVHVNGDLYITSGSGLNITGQVSAAKRDMELWPEANNEGGTLNTFRKDKNDNRSAAKVFDTSNLRSLDKGKTYTDENEGDLSDWNERIQVGLDTLIVPPVNDFGIDEEGTYWSKADLRVLLRLDGSGNPQYIEVHDNDGNTNRADRMVNATTTLNSCIADDLTPPYIGSIDVREKKNDDPEYRYVFFDDLDADPDDTSTDANEHANRVPSDYLDEVSKHKLDDTTPGDETYYYGDEDDDDLEDAWYSMYQPRAIEWSNTFYDGREKTDMLFMEVDTVGLLNCITENSSDFGFDIDDESGGGLVWYLSILGPDSEKVNNYGIRVRNGETLAATVDSAPDIAGLTIVSDQGLYIQGDYNAEASDETNTTWKPASFLGDTINMLSEKFDKDIGDSNIDLDVDEVFGGWDATINWWNYDQDKWDDTNYQPSGKNNDRKAVNTTVRAAVLGGTDKTGNREGTGGKWKGKYNGGLENYPRFHEDWNKKDLVYAGSFVSLGTPQFKDGNWGGSYYRPPNRKWSYEEAYNNAANLPPLSPRATYLSQNSFTRAYPER